MSGLNSTAAGHVMLVYPAICIWSCCHPLGVSRRDGYDIECFITRHAEGEEAGDRRYRVRYFIPVTLSAAGLRSDSGSGSGPAPGEVKVAGATQVNIKAQTTAAR